MSLQQYHEKRRFDVTPEPVGNIDKGKTSNELRFVVQNHDARNLHFDFRLEIGGVFKSWAVPRGPSLDPKVKRLAVEVEDHPLSYGDFEGVIPDDQYGAGSVIIWDRGTWQSTADPIAALAAGKLKFELFGERLRGGWSLLRTRMKGGKQQWLLIKLDDHFADDTIDVVSTYGGSVVSDHTLETIGHLPEFIEPKLPSLTQKPPSGDDWLHELKLDGYRMQAQWRDNEFRLMTRSGIDWTSRFSAIAKDLSTLAIDGAILDGELVAIDEQGKSDFGLLQDRANDCAIAFFAFDLLFDRHRDIRSLPLLQRKMQLRKICDHVAHPRLQYLDHIPGDPDALIGQCKLLGLEGIVSKRIDRRYRSGRASDWIKTKLRYRENLVIGGFEISRTSKSLSSILVGYLDQQGHLLFAGRVGTGWSEVGAAKLTEKLSNLAISQRPFDQDIPASKKARECVMQFVKPLLVAEISFGSWTRNRQLRHASFHALMPAITPDQVTSDNVFADQQSPQAEERKETSSQLIRETVDLPGLSNQQRVLYPKDNLTKEDAAAYLFQVNQWLLPHIANRPISLLRCTDTIDGEQYFQRHPGKGFPSSIESIAIDAESKPLICVSTTDALLATAQINAIELHPWACRRDRMDRPDRMIMDLDPDVGLQWSTTIEAALIVKAELSECGLQSFVKTTGGKGLHLVVPIARRYSWSKVFEFSKAFAQNLERSNPKLFVANMSKARRKGRIFVDFHRNREGATAIAAYSLRARPGATVSTPITWDELLAIRPEEFSLTTVPNRLKTLTEDPWEGITSVTQRLKI